MPYAEELIQLSITMEELKSLNSDSDKLLKVTPVIKNIEGKSELFFFLLLLLFFLPSSSHSLPKNTPRKKLTGHDGDDAGNGFDGLFWGVLGGKKEKERVSWGEFFFEFFFF